MLPTTFSHHAVPSPLTDSNEYLEGVIHQGRPEVEDWGTAISAGLDQRDIRVGESQHPYPISARGP